MEEHPLFKTYPNKKDFDVQAAMEKCRDYLEGLSVNNCKAPRGTNTESRDRLCRCFRIPH